MKHIIATIALIFPVAAFGADNVLNWDDVTGEDGFTVYAKNERCGQTNLQYSPLSNTQMNITTFTHNTGASDDGYNWCYRVTAYNANGESGFSNEAGKVPAAPGALRVN